MASAKAYYEVAKAVRNGILPPVKTQTCADCGKQATDYDHRDYGKPLEVEPTCRSCNLKRGPAKEQRKTYIQVEVPLSVKNAAKRKAMRAGVSLRQWVTGVIKEAK